MSLLNFLNWSKNNQHVKRSDYYIVCYLKKYKSIPLKLKKKCLEFSEACPEPSIDA